MGKNHTKTRRHGKVHELPEEIRKEVDDLLLEPGTTYDDVEAYLKKRGFDISRSSIGRYGQEFLAAYQQIRIVEDQARALVSDAGEGTVLMEAGEKLFAKKVIELLLANEVDVTRIPRILGDFAKLQASSVMREKMKVEYKKKAEKIFNKAEKQLKKMTKTELIKSLREDVYGLS